MHFKTGLLTFLICAVTAGISGATATVPPQPMGDSFAWIQHLNGEWLKGEVKDLQDDTLEFESDEFDTVTLDWEDIHILYAPMECTCLFDDDTTAQGKLSVVGELVTVETPQGPMQYQRSDLRSIIVGELSEKNYWSLKLSLGFTARQGNTDQGDLTSFLHIQRRTLHARTAFDWDSAYGSVEGEETVNNQNGFFRHDAFLTRRFYVRIPSLQYYSDKFQNIKYKFTPGAGLGYELFNRSSFEWNLGAGAGYQFNRYHAVEPGQASTDETSVLLGNTDISWDITKDTELAFRYDTSVAFSGRQSIDHHMKTTLSFDLWKDLELDVSLTWDHIGSPQPREDGSVPDRNDLRTFVGFGWEF